MRRDIPCRHSPEFHKRMLVEKPIHFGKREIPRMFARSEENLLFQDPKTSQQNHLAVAHQFRLLERFLNLDFRSAPFVEVALSPLS